jgi:hypothetical protein
LFWNNDVSIDIGAIHRSGQTLQYGKTFHGLLS